MFVPHGEASAWDAREYTVVLAPFAPGAGSRH